ncbi:MAG: AAA family ATPase [Pseudomonadota bacterium]|nr:AAA family ATPase [Pseudomonadota bacterium]MDP1905903.1 AAA family ATPase [Pseudomonadota bacterium]MDP2351775.1 AAA family ATPase [Pseudomonadota bacterium]
MDTSRGLMAEFPRAQYLNWDVPADRKLILDHAWSPRSGLVVFDEIHKMRGWKNFLKGAWDGRGEGQAMLVTGSARMETFRQGGESLAGRYFAWRLHPFSLRELVETKGMTPQDALDRLLERGSFPEPCLGGRRAGCGSLARVVQIVAEPRQEAQRGRVEITAAAAWLAELAA